jgi:uncharacterized membrane protein YphA (DoxX/SURF4 family)
MNSIITFLLRIALGAGFISAVADRFGYWGAAGNAAVAWGNWENFVQYTSKLNFSVNTATATILAIIATAIEITFGVLLIIGFKIKYIAFLSGILLLIFAMEMSINTHLKSALDASVFVASFAAFLLSLQLPDKWSVDQLIMKKRL